MSVTFIHPDGRFYATNNPYLVQGPRGFMEVRFNKMEDMTHIMVSLDFPGVKEVEITVSKSKKVLHVVGEAKKYNPHDSAPRLYATSIGLFCDCCHLTKPPTHVVSNGVVKLIMTKKKIDSRYTSSTCRPNMIPGYPKAEHGNPLAPLQDINPEDPVFTGPNLLPHPSVLQGPKMSYEAKQLLSSGLYVRIDMPGVPDENFTMVFENGIFIIKGVAPSPWGVSGGREYKANVASLPVGYDISGIMMYGDHGVVRAVIPLQWPIRPWPAW